MLHVAPERLAELADAPLSVGEAAHLEVCGSCARERDAYVALVAMAHAERTPLALPLTRWESIAAELALAPRTAPVSAVAPALVVPRRVTRWPMQVAAGLLLCAGGAMFGRASAGATLLPERSLAAASAANTGQVAGDSPRFASAEEARVAQEQSELVYQQAAEFLGQTDSTAATAGPVTYRSRLAALDRVITTTREALREAPHDPVINDYYLTSIGQREATLRQLNTALPASLRLHSF